MHGLGFVVAEQRTGKTSPMQSVVWCVAPALLAIASLPPRPSSNKVPHPSTTLTLAFLLLHSIPSPHWYLISLVCHFVCCFICFHFARDLVVFILVPPLSASGTCLTSVPAFCDINPADTRRRSLSNLQSNPIPSLQPWVTSRAERSSRFSTRTSSSMSATQSPRSLDRAPTASSGKLTLSFRLVFVSSSSHRKL